ncbi:MAG: phytanoyl-CoA dioxygenase family protein, partial [Planctomycetaceae bacterium]|nr:phytanoyl-CoA dioxygenase family protein [Planctomycetaceae bacterium]
MSSAVSIPTTFSQQEVADFHEQGYLIVRGLGSTETCQRMRAVTQEQMQRLVEPVEFEADLQYPGAPEDHSAPGGRTVRRLKQAFTRDFVFSQWVTSPELSGRLRQLLGPEVVCPLAHHNCVMTKSPRYSSDTGWHQDIRYWSFTRPELVNVWLALGPERLENGCLKLIPGSHLRTFSRDQFDDEFFFREDHPENVPLIAHAVTAELDPGDVLFFHSRTLHAATRNYSQETKLS